MVVMVSFPVPVDGAARAWSRLAAPDSPAVWFLAAAGIWDARTSMVLITDRGSSVVVVVVVVVVVRLADGIDFVLGLRDSVRFPILRVDIEGVDCELVS